MEQCGRIEQAGINFDGEFLTLDTDNSVGPLIMRLQEIPNDFLILSSSG